MSKLADIRNGLKTNLATIPNIQAHAYKLSNPTPPMAQVIPGVITYDEAGARGLDEYEMFVEVMVAATTDIGAQKRLDGLMDPTGTSSIKTAVESDPTLAGHVDDLHVTATEQYGEAVLPSGKAVLGCRFRVRILASN